MNLKLSYRCQKATAPNLKRLHVTQELSPSPVMESLQRYMERASQEVGMSDCSRRIILSIIAIWRMRGFWWCMGVRGN